MAGECKVWIVWSQISDDEFTHEASGLYRTVIIIKLPDVYIASSSISKHQLADNCVFAVFVGFGTAVQPYISGRGAGQERWS